MNSKLTKQGYIINKAELTDDQIETIENDLTIEPEVDERYKKVKKTDDTFNIYLETVKGDKFVVPRYYGIEKFGMPNKIIFDINDIDKININFRGNLRDYQHDIINTILKEYSNDITDPTNTLKKFGGSIISIPPGKGKTVLAIYLITQLKLKALVIVHKTFLLNQWKERISQYTDANIGIIQQDKIDINSKQIVVAMLQSISLKDYDKELFQSFPFVIYDECHHLGAKMFSKSLIKVQAPYYLGLSATPERNDNMDKVFKYFLGGIKYRGKFETNNLVNVKMYSYSIDSPYFKPVYNGYLKSYMGPTMITNICKIKQRNDLIITIVSEILNTDHRRKILILTGRCNSSKNEKSVNHIKELSDRLDNIESFKDNWGYYIGGMKKVQLELSSEKQIIIGTYEMAQEGLDISDLDTLILSTPLKGNITQTCGRILRGGNVYQPLIIDIVDNVKPFNVQAMSRYAYYISNKYNCHFYDVSNGQDIIPLDTPFLKPNFRQIVHQNNKIQKDDDLFEDE